MRKCYLCQATHFERVKGKVRDIPRLPILRCNNCGLVFLGNFDHIDPNFYAGPKMRELEPLEPIMDWQQYLAFTARDDSRRATWLKKTVTGKVLLDFGCGSGGFLGLTKKIAKKCFGLEKNPGLAKTISKKFGIRVYSDIEDIKIKFDVITLFHVLEHVKDPRALLEKLADLLSPQGQIIIEVPNADDALVSFYASKAFAKFTFWSCHLYLFNNLTLQRLVEGAKLHTVYLKQAQRYPLSNHLYWLAKGKPGGHNIWHFLDDKSINRAYEAKLANRGICDTIIASVRKPISKRKGEYN